MALENAGEAGKMREIGCDAVRAGA